jgi:tetratricopeptide (TPR) repeat protein
LAKLAICHYALNEFAEAHARLEEALVFARQNCAELEDRIQIAEILNNLGCLAYMCGQPIAAQAFYSDSLGIQFNTLSESLYESTAFIGQSISLNISITRANIGFVKLVTKDLPVAIAALENALMVSATEAQPSNLFAGASQLRVCLCRNNNYYSKGGMIRLLRLWIIWQ